VPENFVLKEIPKPDVQDGTLAIEAPVIVAIPVDYRDNHRLMEIFRQDVLN
jgi:hypothetical protein